MLHKICPPFVVKVCVFVVLESEDIYGCLLLSLLLFTLLSQLLIQ